MSVASNGTTTTNKAFGDVFLIPIPPTRIYIFGFLLTLLIPSFFCSLYIFYQFIYRREIRQRATNLVIISLVIVNFLHVSSELPFTLTYLWLNRAAVESNQFCQIWNFLGLLLFAIELWITAIGSLERYLFIFHPNFLKKHALFLRFIPLAACFAGPIIFYISLIFLFPCANNFLFFIFWCAGPCFMLKPFWRVLSWIAGQGLPMSIVVLTNILLTIRVLRQKRRMQQTNMWAKNARMFLQLIMVAILYAICWLPFLIVGQVNTYLGVELPILFHIFFEYCVFFPHVTLTLCPFVCLVGLWRDLHGRKGFIAVLFCRRETSVGSIETVPNRSIKALGRS